MALTATDPTDRYSDPSHRAFLIVTLCSNGARNSGRDRDATRIVGEKTDVGQRLECERTTQRVYHWLKSRWVIYLSTRTPAPSPADHTTKVVGMFNRMLTVVPRSFQAFCLHMYIPHKPSPRRSSRAYLVSAADPPSKVRMWTKRVSFLISSTACCGRESWVLYYARC